MNASMGREMTERTAVQQGGAGVPETQEIHALLLDDSQFDRRRIRRLGARIDDLPLRLHEVGTLHEMEAALSRRAYDVILVDYRLSEGTGVEALERISAMARHCGAGRIMITGNEDIGAAVEAMRSGCHDFLAKDDMSAEVLREAMLNAMARARRSLALQEQLALRQAALCEGVKIALQDAEVQESIGAIFRAQLSGMVATLPDGLAAPRSAEIDSFVAGLGASDEFIFNARAD